MQRSKVVQGLVGLAMAAFVVAGCSSGGSDSPEATTTKAEAAATTTTAAGKATTTTAAGGKTTTTETAGTTTTDPSVDPETGLRPGDECSPEEGSPDCIDPDGDGTYTYLIAGNDCMASAPDPSLCEDLDEDGYAGYADSQ